MNGLTIRITFSLFAIQLALSVASMSAQEPTDDRLKLDPTTSPSKSMVDLTGLVSEQKKYSIVVTSAGKKYDVQISKNTTIELFCPSPIVDLKEKRLRIARKGVEKQFKEFSIETPLYLVAVFDHKNQFNRTMRGNPKRLNQFTVASEKSSLTSAGSEFFVQGEILPGASGRQLKLKTETETYDILLGKRGSWKGFSQVDLVANETAIQVRGLVDEQNSIEASLIRFWPTAKSDEDDRKNEAEK